MLLDLVWCHTGRQLQLNLTSHVTEPHSLPRIDKQVLSAASKPEICAGSYQMCSCCSL